jgi:hypothetical protein
MAGERSAVDYITRMSGWCDEGQTLYSQIHSAEDLTSETQKAPLLV